jgi:hypothetical protein
VRVWAQEGLDVTRLGSALVKKERGGRMPQGMSGNNRHPRALAGVHAREEERRSREVNSPTPPTCGDPIKKRILPFGCYTTGTLAALQSAVPGQPEGSETRIDEKRIFPSLGSICLTCLAKGRAGEIRPGCAPSSPFSTGLIFPRTITDNGQRQGILSFRA